ncbi:glycosyltransferase family 2 protein [Paenibacillus xylaniclasticus]|uniref:glycosyltransferase family 2 protein n=1 Tax=Paenibacillus xylaniclasticus TaxID=588083 RepID=UPI000FDB8F07|nr:MULTISPECIES: glycosyltransferase family 2 protein [Paenibacillus]GFN32792.1 hypothetical protein PCURB6_30520 [Paenibacillus curdlanolyticus]
MPSTYDVSIVIVHYNGVRYLKALFDSLLALETDGLSYEVVFVDNGSTDNSISYLEMNYLPQMPNLKILSPGQNLGFAGGNNYGVRNCSGKYVAFLNNDTKVDRGWLLSLYQAMSDPEVGIVNSKLLFFYDFIRIAVRTMDQLKLSSAVKINEHEYTIDPKFCTNLLHHQSELVTFGHSVFYIPLLDGREADYRIEMKATSFTDTDEIIVGDFTVKPTSSGVISWDLGKKEVGEAVSIIQNVGSGVNDEFNGFDIGFCEVDNGQFDTARELQSACGASMMMRKEQFLELGGFDEYFFMYYEDTDLSFRTRAAGKKIMYTPHSVVRHIHTGSSKEWSPFFIYQVMRNRLLFIYKNYPRRVFVKQWLKFAAHVAKSVIRPHESPEVKTAKRRALKDCTKQTLAYRKSGHSSK